MCRVSVKTRLPWHKTGQSESRFCSAIGIFIGIKEESLQSGNGFREFFSPIKKFFQIFCVCLKSGVVQRPRVFSFFHVSRTSSVNSNTIDLDYIRCSTAGVHDSFLEFVIRKNVMGGVYTCFFSS